MAAAAPQSRAEDTEEGEEMGLGFGRPVADVGFDPARRPGSHRIRSDGLHLPAGERAD